MKEMRSLLNHLVACGVALAMVSTLAAQTANDSVAKVVRLKGKARYKVANNDWQDLKVGELVKPGTLIQTAGKSQVDFVMGDGSAPVAAPTAGAGTLGYHPTAEQNMVRVFENTLIGIDKLTVMQTGADEVTDTQLDLKAGRIFGTVKKMSAASKYEIKIPNGVAGIRGSTYECSAEGVIKMLVGSCVAAYVGANGAVVTQVVNALQMFDCRTGVLTTLPDLDKTDMLIISKQMAVESTSPLVRVVRNNTYIYISPH